MVSKEVGDKNHILGPSTVAIAKKFKELIQNDELSIANLEGAGLEWLKVQYNNDVELEYHVSQLKEAVLSEAQWNSDEGDVSKPRSFERHMSKSTKPHPCFYNNDYTYLVDLSTEEKYTTSITKHYAVRYYKEGIEDRIPDRWSKEVRRYHFEALNGIHHWEENIIDFFKAGMSAVTEGNIFSDLRIKSVVRINVKKKCGYGFLTSIVVKRSDDKEYEFNYADLPRLSQCSSHVHQKNRDQEQGRRYSAWSGKLSKNSQAHQTHNVLRRNRLNDTIHDYCNSREMLKKIDEILRHKEQLRRLEEYVGGRPKTINPRTFVRPLGHSGLEATYKILKAMFYWKGMKKSVKEQVRIYTICQCHKPDLPPYPGLLQPFPIPTKIWTNISIDFIEGLPSSHGQTVILVIIDRLNKYGHFIPMSHPFNVVQVAQLFLDTIYKLHGFPQTITSDRDKQGKLLFPYFHLERAQHGMKEFADNHMSDRIFEVGDLVLLKLQTHRQVTFRMHKQHKFSPKFYGPFQVLAKCEVVAYKLLLPKNATVHNGFHVSQLKPFTGQPKSTIPLPHCTTTGLITAVLVAVFDRKIAKVNNAVMVY
ncbi:copia protein [Tanacetum coccineum]